MRDDRNGTVRTVDWGKLSPAEIADALRGAEPDAPLPERLRNPRTPYNLAALREEAADRIEQLEAERDAAYRRGLDEALEAIANLPTCKSEDMMEGQEQAYRAIEAILARIQESDDG